VTCTGTFEWNSYDAAISAQSVILNGTYALNCSRGLLLPTPGDTTQVYRATAIFDCDTQPKASL